MSLPLSGSTAHRLRASNVADLRIGNGLNFSVRHRVLTPGLMLLTQLLYKRLLIGFDDGVPPLGTLLILQPSVNVWINQVRHACRIEPAYAFVAFTIPHQHSLRVLILADLPIHLTDCIERGLLLRRTTLNRTIHLSHLRLNPVIEHALLRFLAELVNQWHDHVLIAALVLSPLMPCIGESITDGLLGGVLRAAQQIHITGQDGSLCLCGGFVVGVCDVTAFYFRFLVALVD